jgi:hypothetical protein
LSLLFHPELSTTNDTAGELLAKTANWYAQLVGTASPIWIGLITFLSEWAGKRFGFIRPITKCRHGQPVKWLTGKWKMALEKAKQLGAELYRGPLKRTDRQYMCQVRDLFGNLLGLVGPKVETASPR